MPVDTMMPKDYSGMRVVLDVYRNGDLKVKELTLNGKKWPSNDYNIQAITSEIDLLKSNRASLKTELKALQSRPEELSEGDVKVYKDTDSIQLKIDNLTKKINAYEKRLSKLTSDRKK